MFEMVHDLRSSLRSLRHRPLYVIVAVSILALGLSASIAVITYINGFYQPFPGADADRLVRVFGVQDDEPYQNISYLDFLDYAAVEGVFEGIAAGQAYYAASVRRETMTEVAFLEAVSGNYFTVLDIEMSVGRGLAVDDDRPGADPAAVISYDWWQRSFNGDRSVIGSVLYLNYRPFTVVGVAAPAFLGSTGDFRPDVWIPIAPFRDRYTGWSAQAENRDIPLVRVFGRLLASSTEEQGLAALNTVATGLDELYPRQQSPRQLRLEAATWLEPRARLAEAPTLRLMIAAAGGLLLLVCANVANLLLSVAAGRQREMAVRAALGASPGRLLRQVLSENVLLSALAGVIALLVAAPASTRLGSYFARPSVWGADVSREATIDLRVVVLAIAISVLTGLVAGILPAIRASRRDVVETLKTDTPASTGGPRRLWGRGLPGVHDLLVSAQVALSVVLLVVAGLILRTLASVADLDPGFQYQSLVASYVSTSSTSVEIEERDQWFRNLAAQLTEEPWVRAATVADNALLSAHGSVDFRIEDRVDPVSLVYSRVIPSFFTDLEIDIRQGRDFAAADTTGAPEVAIINETLARRFFDGGQSVGRRIVWPGANGADDRSFEIIGVVRDVRTRDFLAEHEPTVFFSYPQHNYPSGSALHIATVVDPALSVSMLYRWLREFEPHVAIVNVIPYTEVVRGFLYTQRMNAELFSALAFLGLGLAAVGIFSVMSLAVSRRTREIGIRMAIGAQGRDIRRLMISRALGPVALGLGVGLLVSLAVTGLVQSLLYGIEPHDPIALAAGAGVLILAALSATYLPTRRAVTVDPVTALRREG